MQESSRSRFELQSLVLKGVRVRLIVKLTAFIVAFMYGLVSLGQWLTTQVLQFVSHPLLLNLIPLSISLLLGGAGAWLMIRLVIQRPLNQLKQLAEELGRGNLTARVQIRTGDEFEQLGATFNVMAENIQQLVQHMGSTAGQLSESARRLSESVAATSNSTRLMKRNMEEAVRSAQVLESSSAESHSVLREVQAGIDQVAEGAGKQSTDMQSVSSNLYELIAELEQMAQAAAEAQTVAGTAAGSAEKSTRVIETSLDLLRQIAQVLGEVEGRLATLRENSARVSEINTLIGGIAAQTGLLSLNAAIEAARAGEQGRGFAVVAEEVRKLADRSSQAAGDIGTLITTVQEQVESVFGYTQNLRSRADAGVTQAVESREALQSISQQIQTMSDQMARISEMSRRVGMKGRAAGDAVQSLAAIVQENAAATEQMAAGAAQMDASFGKVQEQVTATTHQLRQVYDEISAIDNIMASVGAVGTENRETAERLKELVGQFTC
ncbi:MAG: methyl-accepting chemotaxis protein [Bacillota bacterium]